MPVLTDALVRRLPKPAKLLTVHDDRLPGFGVRVSQGGTKSFFLRYRNARGVERLITIGRADVWTVAGARKHATTLLREQVSIGIDPLVERQTARKALTVNDVLDAYLASARYEAKAASTKVTDEGRIARHLKPLLGKRFVADLTLDEVERAYRDIAAGKTRSDTKTKLRGRSIARGGEGAARKSIRLLRAAFGWALREKLVDHNPAAGAQVGSDGQRDSVLDAAGYAAVFDALDRLQDSQRVDAVAADAIRVIALTGARRGEIAGLRRAHVDPKRGVITLPPARHKTGKSTGAARIIGLPKAAQDIIARHEGEVVFDVEPDRLSKVWREVAREAALPNGITLHTLRHSLASHMAMDGAQAADIMTALGHRRMSTAQRYIHVAETRRQEIAERGAAVALGAMRRR